MTCQAARLCFLLNAPVALVVALVHRALGRTSPRLTPAQGKALYRQGWQHQQAGAWGAAADCFCRLLRVDHPGLVQAALRALAELDTAVSGSIVAHPVSTAPTALTLLRTAQVLHRRGQTKTALATCRQALQQASLSHDDHTTGLCLATLGALYTNQGKFLQAITRCRAAVHLLATAAPSSQAMAHHNWGVVLYKQGQFEAAQDQFQQALYQWQQTHAPLAEATTLAYLGRSFACQGQYWLALGCLESAGDLRPAEATAPAWIGLMAEVEEELALLCERTGHDNRAITHHLRAVSLYQAMENMAEGAVVLHRLGQLHERLGHVTLALIYFRQGLRLAGSLGTLQQLTQQCPLAKGVDVSGG